VVVTQELIWKCQKLMTRNQFWICIFSVSSSELRSKNCPNPVFVQLKLTLFCTNFLSENFIKNFSILYSPLKRHLVDDPSVHSREPHVITEVMTTTFRETVLLSEKVHLTADKVPCGWLLRLLRRGSHSFFTLMCFAYL